MVGCYALIASSPNPLPTTLEQRVSLDWREDCLVIEPGWRGWWANNEKLPGMALDHCIAVWRKMALSMVAIFLRGRNMNNNVLGR